MNNDDDLDEPLPEYDFTDAVQGKYAGRFAEGTNVVLLDRDVASTFKNSEAVNEALRLLIKIAAQNAAPPSSATKPLPTTPATR